MSSIITVPSQLTIVICELSLPICSFLVTNIISLSIWWFLPLLVELLSTPQIRHLYYSLSLLHQHSHSISCSHQVHAMWKKSESLTTSPGVLFSRHGASVRLYCPYASPQNGNTKRLIRTTKDTLLVLLLPPSPLILDWSFTNWYLHSQLCLPPPTSSS